jgi:hypothetical protein
MCVYVHHRFAGHAYITGMPSMAGIIHHPNASFQSIHAYPLFSYMHGMHACTHFTCTLCVCAFMHTRSACILRAYPSHTSYMLTRTIPSSCAYAHSSTPSCTYTCTCTKANTLSSNSLFAFFFSLGDYALDSRGARSNRRRKKEG